MNCLVFITRQRTSFINIYNLAPIVLTPCQIYSKREYKATKLKKNQLWIISNNDPDFKSIQDFHEKQSVIWDFYTNFLEEKLSPSFN